MMHTSSNFFVPRALLSFRVFLHPLISTYSFFFFNDTATTEIYTLSLHDALPISSSPGNWYFFNNSRTSNSTKSNISGSDRKSTRLNSSHLVISYAVFCLKKKKKKGIHHASL